VVDVTPGDETHGHDRDLPRTQRFEVAYQRLYAPISAYVLRRLAAPEEAAEVVAETFLTLWRRLDDAPDGDALRPWTYGVARRVIANHLRGERRREALTDRVVAEFGRVAQRLPDPAEAVAEQAGLRAALAGLSEQDQELLRLVAWEALSTDEVAIALGVRAGAVRLRLYRARRRLEAALSQQSDAKHDATPGQVIEHRESREHSRVAEGAS
jgi:RNA polymerase sigma factor (sigma-70 family)